MMEMSDDDLLPRMSLLLSPKASDFENNPPENIKPVPSNSVSLSYQCIKIIKYLSATAQLIVNCSVYCSRVVTRKLLSIILISIVHGFIFSLLCGENFFSNRAIKRYWIIYFCLAICQLS